MFKSRPEPKRQKGKIKWQEQKGKIKWQEQKGAKAEKARNIWWGAAGGKSKTRF